MSWRRQATSLEVKGFGRLPLSCIPLVALIMLNYFDILATQRILVMLLLPTWPKKSAHLFLFLSLSLDLHHLSSHHLLEGSELKRKCIFVLSLTTLRNRLGSSKHGWDEKCISSSTFTVIFGKRDLLAMAAHPPAMPAAFPKTLPSRTIEFSGWLEKL